MGNDHFTDVEIIEQNSNRQNVDDGVQCPDFMEVNLGNINTMGKSLGFGNNLKNFLCQLFRMFRGATAFNNSVDIR